jgi:hypothetical protein
MASFLLPYLKKIDIDWNTGIMECWNTGMMGDKKLQFYPPINLFFRHSNNNLLREVGYV